MKIATVGFHYGTARLDGILENHLKSLRWQKRQPDEIIIVDEAYNEDSSSAERIRETLSHLCHKYGARLIQIEPRPEDRYWNKPRAVNAGVRRTSEDIDIVINLDLDMVLHPSLLESVHQSFQQDPASFVMCWNRSLPEPVELPDSFDPKAWKDLAAKSIFIPRGTKEKPIQFHPVGPASQSTGCLQAATRAWWHKVRGYDEDFSGPGGKDGDLARRAELAHRWRVWLGWGEGPDSLLLHQYHAGRTTHEDDSEQAKELKACARVNSKHSILRCMARKIIRNDENWGAWGS